MDNARGTTSKGGKRAGHTGEMSSAANNYNGERMELITLAGCEGMEVRLPRQMLPTTTLKEKNNHLHRNCDHFGRDHDVFQIGVLIGLDTITLDEVFSDLVKQSEKGSGNKVSYMLAPESVLKCQLLERLGNYTPKWHTNNYSNSSTQNIKLSGNQNLVSAMVESGMSTDACIKKVSNVPDLCTTLVVILRPTRKGHHDRFRSSVPKSRLIGNRWDDNLPANNKFTPTDDDSNYLLELFSHYI